MQREPLTRPKPRGFKPGDAKPANSGRKPGVANRVTRTLREATLLACAQSGYDRKGKDGLTGYLRRIAEKHPDLMCQLLGRILPLQASISVAPVRQNLTLEQLQERLKERGLPPNGFDPPLPPPKPTPPAPERMPPGTLRN